MRDHLRLPVFVALAALTGCAERLSVSEPAISAAQRAQQLVHECRYDDAEKLVQSSLGEATGGDRGVLLLAGGNVAENRGNLQLALARYQEAANLDPAPEDAFRLLGLAQVRHKDFAAGYRTLEVYVAHWVERNHALPNWTEIAALSIAAAESGHLGEARTLLAGELSSQAYSDLLVRELKAKVDDAARTPAAVPAGTFWDMAYGDPASSAMSQDFSAQPGLRVPPSYPYAAARDGIGGYVDLEVSLDESGNVTGARVLASQPAGVFDAASLAAIRQWKFKPAVRQCRAVPSKGTQRIQYVMARP